MVLQEIARPEDLQLLESTKLGSHPMMIRELATELKKMEPDYIEALNAGSMRDAQINSLRIKAQDLISRVINDVKNRYIKFYGPMKY